MLLLIQAGESTLGHLLSLGGKPWTRLHLPQIFICTYMKYMHTLLSSPNHRARIDIYRREYVIGMCGKKNWLKVDDQTIAHNSPPRNCLSFLFDGNDHLLHCIHGHRLFTLEVIDPSVSLIVRFQSISPRVYQHLRGLPFQVVFTRRSPTMYKAVSFCVWYIS